MKKFNFFSITMVISIMFLSCKTEFQKEEAQEIQHINIALVLDGSDVMTQENSIPIVSVEEMADWAKAISTNGMGAISVTYVDSDVDNNGAPAIFSWREEPPSELGKKPNSESVSAWRRKKSENESKKKDYERSLAAASSKFQKECEDIHRKAYNELVYSPKKGSDINGAINQAYHVLLASKEEGDRCYMVLVSDGIDNRGKELSPISPEIEVILVCSNASRHQYGSLVTKEFATLEQAKRYIFSK